MITVATDQLEEAMFAFRFVEPEQPQASLPLTLALTLSLSLSISLSLALALTLARTLTRTLTLTITLTRSQPRAVELARRQPPPSPLSRHPSR